MKPFFPKPYSDFVQRLRVPCGFLLLVAFAAFARPTPASLVIGLPVSVCGLLVRAWAAGHLAKDRALAISGPYAYLRNPLYAGTLLTAFGLLLAARNATLAILFAAVFLLVYLPAIELEEQHLAEIFPDYAAYVARVRRFIPGRAYRAGGVRFSTALYRRNEEYKAAAGWLIAAVWLLWRAFYK